MHPGGQLLKRDVNSNDNSHKIIDSRWKIRNVCKFVIFAHINHLIALISDRICCGIAVVVESAS